MGDAIPDDRAHEAKAAFAGDLGCLGCLAHYRVRAGPVDDDGALQVLVEAARLVDQLAHGLERLYVELAGCNGDIQAFGDHHGAAELEIPVCSR